MRRRWLPFLLIACAAVALGCAVVWLQVRMLGGWYLENEQVERHRAVLESRSISTWNYRLLPDLLLEAVAPVLGGMGAEQPLVAAFVGLRYAQNAVLFVLVAEYYRRLGLRSIAILVGLSIFAWSMTQAILAADLQWSSYFDVIFYVLAVLLVMSRAEVWLIPLTAIAALNRETSLLMPFLALLAPGRLISLRVGELWSSIPRRSWLITALALCVYVAVNLALRKVIGPKPAVGVGENGPGLPLFLHNVVDPYAWGQNAVTVMLVPIVALLGWRCWPPMLRNLFWVIAVPYIVAHMFLSALSETRYLLVPMALVFVPGCILVLLNESGGAASEPVDPGLIHSGG